MDDTFFFLFSTSLDCRCYFRSAVVLHAHRREKAVKQTMLREETKWAVCTAQRPRHSVTKKGGKKKKGKKKTKAAKVLETQEKGSPGVSHPVSFGRRTHHGLCGPAAQQPPAGRG